MNMNDRADWIDRSSLIAHLARELVRGRLGLLLGAGTSQFYGLPSWAELVSRVCLSVGEAPPAPGTDLTMRINGIRGRHFKDNPRKFLEAVKRNLYKGLSVDFVKLRSNDTLSALGALVMSSSRGSCSKLVTFNYDDLLESYLEYYGVVSDSIIRPQHWASSRDVSVYHPHGFLPLTSGREWSSDIVFGTNEYLDIMSGTRPSLWRTTLDSILRTHTVIQIGLSGADIHLQSLLQPLKESHAINTTRFAYHGIRLALEATDNQDVRDSMSDWGVHTHPLNSYDELAPFLFDICQAARRIRLGQIKG